MPAACRMPLKPFPMCWKWIGGDREDLLEIVVDAQVLESYGIDFDQLAQLVTRNNQLVAAGSLDTGNGRMALKVPGVIENIEDVMSMPVKVDGDTVVTFGDIAMLQRIQRPHRLPGLTASRRWCWRCPSAPGPTSSKPSSRFPP